MIAPIVHAVSRGSPAKSRTRVVLVVFLAGTVQALTPNASRSVPFAGLDVGLPQVNTSSVAWGDYDSDGDLDILFAGWCPAENGDLTRLYRNDGGDVFNESASFPGVHSGSVDWGDYDNDGDLDVLLTGWWGAGAADLSRVYRNDGDENFPDNFPEVASFPGVDHSSAKWGDYDNDGDLDVLLTGSWWGTPLSRVYRNDGDNSFPETASFPGVTNSSVAWGDYDNDGDLDIALTGSWSGTPISHIYRNDGADSFFKINQLPGVVDGAVAWGDHDGDGDLDLLLTGLWSTYTYSRLYENIGNGAFPEIASFRGVSESSVGWGDYDNDGDLDILLAGYWGGWGIPLTRLYRNLGNDAFLEDIGVEGVRHCSVAWGDYDNDADLDFLLTGATDTGTISLIYRNDAAPANTPPSAPTGLQAQAVVSTLQFSWDPATDAETVSPCLTYNLRVGTTPGGSQVLSAMAAPSGYRKVAALGNVNHNTTWTIERPDPAVGVYYWSVQAIDAGLAGSEFAPEQTLLDLSTGAPELDVSPTGCALYPIVPNPFRATATVRYDLPRAGPARITVFDLVGKRVRTLVSDREQAGPHASVWDGRDGAGVLVTPGVYFVRLESGDFSATRKVVRIR